MRIGSIEIDDAFVKILTDEGNVVLTASGELLNFGDSVPEDDLRAPWRPSSGLKNEGIVISKDIYKAIADSYYKVHPRCDIERRCVFETKDRILIAVTVGRSFRGMTLGSYYEKGSYGQLMELIAIIEINKENFEISVDIARRFFLCNEKGYICFGQNENGGITHTEVIGNKVTVNELDLDAAISRLLASRKRDGYLELPCGMQQNRRYDLSNKLEVDCAVALMKELSLWLQDGKLRCTGPGSAFPFGPGNFSGPGTGPGWNNANNHVKKRFGLRDLLDFLSCD